jgi:hypothetical protein
MENGPSVLLSNAGGQNDLYNGIGRFRRGADCTAVFLDTVGAAGPRDAPAYLLTNGHCIRLLGSNEVVLDQAPAGEVRFNFFADTQEQQVKVAGRRVVAATMKGQDVALVELDSTYAELVGRGLSPWRVASFVPAPDEPVAVVGAPQMSDPNESFLRLARCRAGERVGVLLERQWHWFGFYRNTCADIRGGSSGSPVILERGRRLIGLVNTTTIGSEGIADCYLNRPCEVDASGSRSREGTSYVTPLLGIEKCFGEDGRADVRSEGCPLDDGRQLDADPSWLASVNPTLPPTRPGQPQGLWGVTLSGAAFAYYRYKTGPAASVECTSPNGYGTPIRLGPASRIDNSLPGVEAHHFLCILGSATASAELPGQDPRFATVVSVEIDKTPPRIPPELRVTELGESYRVEWIYAPPEISLYQVKYGTFAEIDCKDPGGYRAPLLGFVMLPRSGSPYRVCAIGFDLAGNPTPPTERVLG